MVWKTLTCQHAQVQVMFVIVEPARYLHSAAVVASV